MVVVEKRDAETLIPIIKKWILPGEIVVGCSFRSQNIHDIYNILILHSFFTQAPPSFLIVGRHTTCLNIMVSNTSLSIIQLNLSRAKIAPSTPIPSKDRGD